MKYGDLDLKAIIDNCDIEFAHYTYPDGMCTCCYAPIDFPQSYWIDKEKMKQVFKKEDDRDYEYLVFKNADNGSGTVRADDEIDNPVIGYRFKDFDKKMPIIIKELERQMGNEYEIIPPESNSYCIEIRKK